MDAFELLREDQAWVRGAFARLGRRLGAGADERRRLFDQLERRIRVHDCLERLVVFPASRKHEAFRLLVNESEKKHDDIDLRLIELEASSTDDPLWWRWMLEFEEMVEKLFSREEETLYRRLEEALSPEERADLTRKVSQVRLGLVQAAADEEREAPLARAA